MPGLLLNGKQIEKIIKEDNLLILTDMLTKAKSKYLIAVEYLRCLRALHSLMVSKLLNPQYKTIINEFRVLFDKCFRMGLVTETPKCHILYCHLEEWFDERKETLWWADTSGEVTIMFNGEIHLIHFIYLLTYQKMSSAMTLMMTLMIQSTLIFSRRFASLMKFCQDK